MSRTGLILGVAIAVVLTGGVAAFFSDPSNGADSASTGQVWSAEHGHYHDDPSGVAPSSRQDASVPATDQVPSSVPSGAADTPGVPGPQPPGPAPAGKVWSAEHGHWHDAPSIKVEASQTGGNLTATTNRERPQPPGTRGGQLQPMNPDAPPPGMVWHEEHGHFHRAEGLEIGPTAQPPTVSVGGGGASQLSKPIPQPEGPAPEGKVWSAEHGHWHDAPGNQGPQ